MSKVSAKAVLCNFVTSYVSSGFLLMMRLFCGQSVVGWIIVFHFLEVAISSIYANYSESKTLQL